MAGLPFPAALAMLAALSAAARMAAAEAEVAASDEPGYSPAEPAERASPWAASGYLDIGFARAQGDGTSFHPGDTRLPADYGVDTFATAVNARGDVASTVARGLFTNGFLPRSLEIGGRPSFFVNSLSGDLRYEARPAPIMAFARLHVLPRFTEGGSQSQLLVEQAFGRVALFPTHELAVSVGKFDSVFGIEYLENPAILRTGITPSLLARYTTGQSLGVKAFTRRQIARLWSALSLNLAATNSAPLVEALQPSEVSLTGMPVASGRLGYELNLPGFQLKLGASAMAGPRNDQGDRDAGQRALGGDGRLYAAGVTLQGEYVRVDQEPGPAADKRTGAGPQTLASGFHARAFYAVLSYELPWSSRFFRKTALYARFERRHAWFEGFTPLTVERLTTGLRLDLWETLALKCEYLLNRELEGAPTVPNDVIAASLVFGF